MTETRNSVGLRIREFVRTRPLVGVGLLLAGIVFFAVAVVAGSQLTSDQSTEVRKRIAVEHDFFLMSEAPAVVVDTNRSWFDFFGSSQPWTIVSIETENNRGERSPVQLSKSVFGRDERGVILLTDASIQPGRNRVFLTVKTPNGKTVAYSDEFLWGTIGVNVRMATGLVDQDNPIGIAVLDDRGVTVCDATITALITSPSGKVAQYSTGSGNIKISPTCADKSVTNEADYLIDFKPLESGRYALSLTANTISGTRTITEGFDVVASSAIQIERSAFPFRIYPVADYRVVFSVKSDVDRETTIVESVPAAFIVSDVSGGGKIQVNGERKEIHWTTQIAKDTSAEFSYQIDFPNVSPALYQIGPIAVGDYRESRAWQIVSDSACSSVQPGNWTAAATWSPPCDVAGGPVAGDSVTISSGHTVTVGSPDSVAALSLVIDNGAVLNGDGNLTIDGTVNGAGTATMTGGTFTIKAGGLLGSASDWTFNNLTLGDGTTTANTTQNGAGTITVSSVLTIQPKHTLYAGSTTWLLPGTGTPFVQSGVFVPQTSTFTYSNGTNAAIAPTTYNNLITNGAGSFTVSDPPSDDFERAAFGSDWTTRLGFPTISGNSDFSGSAAGDNLAEQSSGTFSADQWSEMVISGMTIDREVQTCVRIQPASDDRYCFATDGDWTELYGWIGGAYQTIIDEETQIQSNDPVVGDIIRLEIVGTTLRVYYNHVLQYEATNASLSTGRPGLNVFNSGSGFGFPDAGTIESWRGGSVFDVNGDMTVGAGSLDVGKNHVHVYGGDMTVNGISYTQSTDAATYLVTTGSISGSGSITFGHLHVGTITSTQTTSLTSSAITVKKKLWVTSSSGVNTLNGGSTIIWLTGSGTMFNIGATAVFQESNSTVAYASPNGSMKVTAATYANLQLTPTCPASSPTYTLGTDTGQTISVKNFLTVGDGNCGPVADWNTYDPELRIGERLIISATGDWVKSDSASLTFYGSSISQEITDSRAPQSDVGKVVIGDGTGSNRFTDPTDLVATSIRVRNNAQFQPGAHQITLVGNGTPLQIDAGGTFTSAASTIRYYSTAATIATTAYHNLEIFASNSSVPNFPLGVGSTLSATGNVTLGDGTWAVNVNSFPENPTVDIDGSFTIATGSIFSGPNSPFRIGGDWINNGTFNDGNGSVEFDGPNPTVLTTNCASYDSCGAQDFYDFVINKDSSAVTVTLPAAKNMRVLHNFSINSGEFIQGDGAGMRVEAVTTVGTEGIWTNQSTGVLSTIKLGGNLTNAGVITLQANGPTCGQADDISIVSTIANNIRTWSGGGAFNLQDLDVSDMGGNITVSSSTLDPETRSAWTNVGCAITVSGTIEWTPGNSYANVRGNGACTSEVPRITAVVNGNNALKTSTTCNADATYSMQLSLEDGADTLTVYLDPDSSTLSSRHGVTVSKVGNPDLSISGLNIVLGGLYLRVDHQNQEEGGQPVTVTNADVGLYDSDQDTDIPADSDQSGASWNLITQQFAWVYSGALYQSGGTVETNTLNGDFHVADGADATLYDPANGSSIVGRKIVVDGSGQLKINSDVTVVTGAFETSGDAIVDTTAGTPTVTLAAGTSNYVGGGGRILKFFNLRMNGGSNGNTFLTSAQIIGTLTLPQDQVVNTPGTMIFMNRGLAPGGNGGYVAGNGATIGNISFSIASGTILDTPSAVDLVVDGQILFANNNALTLDGSAVLVHTGGDFTLTAGSSVIGTGLLVFNGGSSGPGVNGSLNTVVRFDASNGDISSSVFANRTYSNNVEAFSAGSGNPRTITVNASAGLHFEQNLIVVAGTDQVGTLTLNTAGLQPVVIDGNLSFTKQSGAATPVFNPGNVIVQVGGDANFSNGQFTPGSNGVLEFTGSDSPAELSDTNQSDFARAGHAASNVVIQEDGAVRLDFSEGVSYGERVLDDAWSQHGTVDPLTGDFWRVASGNFYKYSFDGSKSSNYSLADCGGSGSYIAIDDQSPRFVWIAGPNGRICKYGLDGAYVTTYIVPGSPSLDALIFNPVENELWVRADTAGKVYRYNLAGALLQTYDAPLPWGGSTYSSPSSAYDPVSGSFIFIYDWDDCPGCPEGEWWIRLKQVDRNAGEVFDGVVALETNDGPDVIAVPSAGAGTKTVWIRSTSWVKAYDTTSHTFTSIFNSPPSKFSYNIVYDQAHDAVLSTARWNDPSPTRSIEEYSPAGAAVGSSTVQFSDTVPDSADRHPSWYDPIHRQLWAQATNSSLISSSRVQYLSSGTYESAVYDTQGNIGYGQLTWTKSTPANTTLTLQVRTGNAPDLSDAPAWGSCQLILAGTVSLASANCVNAGDRYIQYRGNFTTSDPAISPSLYDVTIEYTSADVNSLTAAGSGLAGLKISGGGLKSVDDAVLSGDLSIVGGAYFAPTGTATIGGDWVQTSGIFYARAGTIKLTGGSTSINTPCANVDTCTETAFENLVIEKSAPENTVSLGGKLRVLRTVTVETGKLVQGIHDVRIDGSTAIVNTAQGTWTNMSTGDLVLGGNVDNSGSFVLDSVQSGCGDTRNIEVRAVNLMAPVWQGSGSFTMQDLVFSGQTLNPIPPPTEVRLRNTQDAGSNSGNWVFMTGCGVNLSGRLVDTDESTPIQTTGTIRVVNGATGATASIGGTDANGLWSISDVPDPSNGQVLTFWIDGANENSTLVLKFGATCTDYPNCSDFVMAKDRVTLRNDHTGNIQSSDLANCDSGGGTNCGDDEIGFSVNAGRLVVGPDREFHVSSGDAFAADGAIETDAAGGDFHVDNGASATLSVSGNVIRGRLSVDDSATLTLNADTTLTTGDIVASGVITTSASAPTVTIQGTGTMSGTSVTFYNLTLSGTPTIDSATFVRNDLVLSDAAYTGSGFLRMTGATGRVFGNGARIPAFGVETAGAGVTLQDTGPTTDVDLGVDALSVASGKTLTLSGSSVLQVGVTGASGFFITDATIDGTGTLSFTNLSQGPGTAGTILSRVRFDASLGDISETILDVRAYGGDVEIYNDSQVGRSVTMSPTPVDVYTIAGNLLLNNNGQNAGAGAILLTGGTNDPAVELSGSLSANNGGVNDDQDLVFGGSVWTIHGNVDLSEFDNVDADGGTIVMDGAANLMTGQQTLFNLTISPGAGKTITLADETHAIAGNLVLSGAGNLNPGTSTITLSGGGKSIQADGQAISNLVIAGDITLVGTGLTVTGSTTLNVGARFDLQSRLVSESMGSVLIFPGALLTSTGINDLYLFHNVLANNGGLLARVTYDLRDRDLTLPNGPYGNVLAVVNDSTNSRVARLPSGSFSNSGQLRLGAINTGAITLDSATNHPNAVLGGFEADASPVDFSLSLGTSNWTIGGGDLDLANVDTVTAGTSVVRVVAGSLISAGHQLHSLDLSPLSSADTVSLSATGSHLLDGDLTLGSAGTIAVAGSTVKMVGSGGTIDGNGRVINELQLDTGPAGSISFIDDLQVSGNLSVSANTTASLADGKGVTIGSGATLALSGSIAGDGTLVYRPSTAFPSSGSVSSRVDFDTVDNSQTVPGRSFGGPVRMLGTDVIRTVTLTGTTIDFQGSLTLVTDGVGDLTLDATADSPDVNAQNISGSGGGAGSREILSGAGTWTVEEADFSSIRYVAYSSNRFVMSGAGGVLVPASTIFRHLFLTPSSGTLQVSGSTLTVGGDLVLGGAGVIDASTVVVHMSGNGSAITGGGKRLHDLAVDSSTINLTDSDLHLNGTLSIGAGRVFQLASGTILHLEGPVPDWGDSSSSLSGSGKVQITSTSSGPGTGGQLNANVDYVQDQPGTMSVTARNYGANLRLVPCDTLQLSAGATQVSQNLSLDRGDCGATPQLDSATNAPMVNVNGDLGVVALDRLDLGGTWTIKGSASLAGVSNFTGGNSTLTMSTQTGAESLVSSGHVLASLHLDPDGGSSISLGDSVTVSGKLTLSGAGGIVSAGQTVVMAGANQVISGGGKVLENLTIVPTTGTITVSESDLEVSGNLAVNSGKVLALDSGRILTVSGSNEIAWGDGMSTVSGAGTLRFTPGAGGPGVGGRILAKTRFDASNGDISDATFDPRIYEGTVELHKNFLGGRQIQLAENGNYRIIGSGHNLEIDSINAGTLTIDAETATTDPNVQIDGSVLFAPGAEATLLTGAGAWEIGGDLVARGSVVARENGSMLVSGNVDFSTGSYGKRNGSGITMNGSGIFTGFGNTFQNLTFSPTGTISFSGDVRLSGNLKLGSGGTINPGGTTFVVDSPGTTIDGGGRSIHGLSLTAGSGSNTVINSDLSTENLNLSNGSNLAIDNGRELRHFGSSYTGTGTVSGAGMLVFTPTSSGPDDATTISVAVRYDATTANIPAATFDARTYQNRVEIFSGHPTEDRRVDVPGSELYTLAGSSDLVIKNDGGGNLDLNVAAVGVDSNFEIGGDIQFAGAGGKSITAGTGTWTIHGDADFTNGSFVASAGNKVIMDGAASILRAAGNSLYDYEQAGGQTSLAEETTVANDLKITSGVLIAPAGNLRVGGNFENQSTFQANGGTVLMNAGTTGKFLRAGASGFENLTFDSPAGGWSIEGQDVVVDGLFSALRAASLTLGSGRTLTINGSMNNQLQKSVGHWDGSTLSLMNPTSIMEINPKTSAGNDYGTIRVGSSSRVEMWNSDADNFNVENGGALWSQDHGAVDGRLNLYGNVTGRTNEFWDYDSDFDGVGLPTPRQVDVRFEPGTTFRVPSGRDLSISGDANFPTLLSVQGGGGYGLVVQGNLTARNFNIEDLDSAGLVIEPSANIGLLTDGTFDNSAGGIGSAYVTVSKPGSEKAFRNIQFDAPADGADPNVTYNVKADGAGLVWSFLGASGNLAGEAYDAESNGAQVLWDEGITSVNDGGGSDIDIQNNTRTLLANWTSTIVPGIARFEVAVGTSPGATGLRAFTSVGLSTTTTISNLSLADGQTYYITVRSVDDTGQTLSQRSSDGIRIDSRPPMFSEITPSSTKTSITLSWLSDEEITTFVEYGFTKKLGSTTSETSFYQQAHAVTMINFTPGTTVYLKINGRDRAGNVSQSDLITVTLQSASGGEQPGGDDTPGGGDQEPGDGGGGTGGEEPSPDDPLFGAPAPTLLRPIARGAIDTTLTTAGWAHGQQVVRVYVGNTFVGSKKVPSVSSRVNSFQVHFSLSRFPVGRYLIRAEAVTGTRASKMAHQTTLIVKEVNGHRLYRFSRPISYLVQRGDSLWRISQTFFGTGASYVRLVAAPNTTRYPTLSYLPSLIYRGWFLTIRP